MILNTVRAQSFDPSLFTAMGIEPLAQKILVIKSTNHFHAAFAPIASEVIYCSAGQPYPNDPGAHGLRQGAAGHLADLRRSLRGRRAREGGGMSFPWPEAGARIEDLPTPMPVIDEDRLAKNIARAQGYLDGHGKAFRPHIKTHKIPAVARAQLAAGAVGINCQKVTEAEAFADAGFEDILITYNILGPAKPRGSPRSTRASRASPSSPTARRRWRATRRRSRRRGR